MFWYPPGAVFDSAEIVVMPNGMSPFLVDSFSRVDRVMAMSGKINLKL